MAKKDYYKILGVSPSASEEEIKQAFFRLAKKYHPDRHRGKGSADYAARFAEINEAYNVLKDPASKAAYDREYGGTGTAATRRAEQKYRAEELYETALKALKIRDVNSAIDLLKAATRIAPQNAEYWSMLGMALSEKPRRLHEAREMCERAVEMEPYDVENYVRLGLVYKKAGLQLRARRQFEQALRWDPSHPTARRELGLGRRPSPVERLRAWLAQRGRSSV